ncbi:MAG: DUF6923 family protein [Pyrinomonadaceae bacterium]
MKTLVKALVCAVALISAPSLVSAQIGFTVADFNGGAPQRLYRFDVNDGIMEDLGVIETNAEQEGLFSVGSLLFGYSENDPALATDDERNPGTRILPFPGANAPNLLGVAPNINRRVCAAGAAAQFGTESGAGYNPVDGYVYVVNSNDNPNDGVVGSRFFRFKPGCTGFQQIGPQSAVSVDGLAVDPNGTVYVSDFRISDRIYRLNTTTGALTPIGSLGFPINRDSGLAWDFENNRLLGLAENGVIYVINTTTGVGTILSTLTLNGGAAPTDLEGFDIPQQDPIP